MTAQPRPDYIVKPMPASIPTFEIAPLERAATDRAANADQFAGETPLQRGFRLDGVSKGNVPMLLTGALVFLALNLIGALGAALFYVAATYWHVISPLLSEISMGIAIFCGAFAGGMLARRLFGAVVNAITARRAARAAAEGDRA